MKEKRETPHEINRQYTKYVSMLDRAEAELAAALAELREANKVIELAECALKMKRHNGATNRLKIEALYAIKAYKGSKP